MILVNIFIPLIDKEYEFKLNEDVPVYWIIEEVSALICQKKEQFTLPSNTQKNLCFTRLSVVKPCR